MDCNKFITEWKEAKPAVNTDRRDDLIMQSLEADRDYDRIPIMCMEEMCELSQAISKSIRKGPECMHMNLIEEMADVIIALSYLYYRFDVSPDEVGKAINVKLDRLERKLKENGRYE